jgi:DNA oxidative demethylase
VRPTSNIELPRDGIISAKQRNTDGFVYRPEFISSKDEQQLIRRIEKLEFGTVKMHGVAAKRRIVHFGRSYEFETFKLGPAAAIPDFFLPMRERAGELADRDPAEFAEALVTEYPPGAGIGWHRDAPHFGVIVGISLLAECRMQFRPWPVEKRVAMPTQKRAKPVAQLLARRSAYTISGSARTEWQHHIPATKTLRYSITFRTLRNKSGLEGQRSAAP